MGGEYQVFPSKIFRHTVPKTSVGESFTVAIISAIEKVWIRVGGGRGEEYQDFPSKIFCLTVPKISVRESFTVAITSGIEKIWTRGGGEYQDFPLKIFCLTVPKTSVGESFTVANFGCRKSLDKGGEYQDFPSKIFCLTVPKISVGGGILYCCKNFGYRKSRDERGGGSVKIFRRKLFVPQCRKVP